MAKQRKRRRSRRPTRWQRNRFRRSQVREQVGEMIGDNMHAKRVDSVADGVTGVLEAASVSIAAIGAGLAANDGLNPKHAIKQVDRLLSNEKLDLDDVFGDWTSYVVGLRRSIVVALDWTEFDRDDQSTITINLLTKHGRATPLIWKTVRKSELKDQRNDHEDALVRQFLEELPADVSVVLLADRGFGDQAFYSFLQDNGIDFVIRFRANILVTDAKGQTKSAGEWMTPSGRVKKLTDVSVTADKTPIAAVVVVHDKEMADPWCLATSLGQAKSREIINLYAKRFKIEETFRDQKDPRFGLGLSQVRIGSPFRRDRLLLLCALAHALLTLLGAAGERVGLDRTLKANTVKRRVHSLFKQGLFWYNALPNMPNMRRKKLLHSFNQIVKQQKVFRNAFGLV